MQEFLVSDDVKKIQEREGAFKVNSEAMVELMQNLELQLQLAASVDFCRVLVLATYALEIDGPAIFFAHQLKELAFNSLDEAVNPPDTMAGPVPANIAALFEQTPLWSADLPRARALVRPALDYFKKQLDPITGKHKSEVKLWKALRGFAPWDATALNSAALKDLEAAKLITKQEREAIEKSGELQRYYNDVQVALTDEESAPMVSQPSDYEFLKRQSPNHLLPEARIWRFWVRYQLRLPLLFKLCKRAALLQPTSAGAERAFSMYRHDANTLAGQSSLEYIEARLTYHYNTAVEPMAKIPLDDVTVLPAPLH